MTYKILKSVTVLLPPNTVVLYSMPDNEELRYRIETGSASDHHLTVHLGNKVWSDVDLGFGDSAEIVGESNG